MTSDPSLALDFVNTCVAAGGGPDTWSTPEDVWAWLTAAGLAPDSPALRPLTPPESRLLMDDALRLRRALAELLDAWTTPGSASPGMALLEVNRLLDARPRRHLVLGMGSQGYELTDRVARTTAAGSLARVAEAGAHLLAHQDPTRVRRCAAPGCGRWFLDTSKNQRRRWCSMAVCGNRAKVAAHHRRTRGARG